MCSHSCAGAFCLLFIRPRAAHGGRAEAWKWIDTPSCGACLLFCHTLRRAAAHFAVSPACRDWYRLQPSLSDDQLEAQMRQLAQEGADAEAPEIALRPSIRMQGPRLPERAYARRDHLKHFCV